MKTVVMLVMAVIMNITGPFTNMGMKVDAMITKVETKVETVADDIKTVTYVEKNFMGKGDEDEHYTIYRMSDGNYRIIYENKAFCHTDNYKYVEIVDYDCTDIDYIDVRIINTTWDADGVQYAKDREYIDDTMTKLAIKR